MTTGSSLDFAKGCEVNISDGQTGELLDLVRSMKRLTEHFL